MFINKTANTDIIFIADMDGTLTPARLPMTSEFVTFFELFIESYCFYVISGSDYKKICEQMPERIIKNLPGIYASMGNEFYEKGQLIYKNEFQPKEDLLLRLEEYRKNTEYEGSLYPNYIEKRCGMLNFSVLGRNCPYEARNAYKKWDNEYREREKIAKELSEIYPDYDISVGGNISVDIVPRGFGKEQIAKKLRDKHQKERIIFLGDRTEEGGNDYSLAKALLEFKNTEVIAVDDPNDTLNYLGKYSEILYS